MHNTVKNLLDIEKIIFPEKKLTVSDKRLTNLEKKVTIIKNITKTASIYF